MSGRPVRFAPLRLVDLRAFSLMQAAVFVNLNLSSKSSQEYLRNTVRSFTSSTANHRELPIWGYEKPSLSICKAPLKPSRRFSAMSRCRCRCQTCLTKLGSLSKPDRACKEGAESKTTGATANMALRMP
jgi:hypothetical protein